MGQRIGFDPMAARRRGAGRSFSGIPGWGGLIAVLTWISLAWSSFAWAYGPPADFTVTGDASGASAESAPPPEAVPDLGLESLLKLPSSWTGDEEKRQGMTSGQWRARFAELVRERREIENGLAEARRELDGMAGEGGGGPWQMGAPGSNNSEVTPMSFKHREQIREGKEKLQENRLRARDLSIEADLAGVPESWRKTASAPAP